MLGRMLIMAGLIQLLAGCAAQAMGITRGGENATYRATNITPQTIEVLKVHAPGNPAKWYEGASEMQSGRPNDLKLYRPIPGAGGGNRFSADNGHIIPGEVEVHWRKMPAPGAKEYTGEKVGPFRVKVRERIPPEILRLARKEKMEVVIAFGVDEERILVNWGLAEYSVLLKTGIRGIVTLCVGGDSYTDPNLKSVFSSLDSDPAPIGVWPHCKLP